VKNYELTYLISPDFDEEEIKSLQEKINSSIKEEGGILKETSLINKINLPRPIKNFNQVRLSTLNFQLEAGKIGALEKKLKAESSVLRFLIFSKTLPKKLPEIAVKGPKKVFEPKEKKVELKEIEKKLEEILEET